MREQVVSSVEGGPSEGREFCWLQGGHFDGLLARFDRRGLTGF